MPYISNSYETVSGNARDAVESVAKPLNNNDIREKYVRGSIPSFDVDESNPSTSASDERPNTMEFNHRGILSCQLLKSRMSGFRPWVTAGLMTASTALSSTSLQTPLRPILKYLNVKPRRTSNQQVAARMKRSHSPIQQRPIEREQHGVVQSVDYGSSGMNDQRRIETSAPTSLFKGSVNKKWTDEYSDPNIHALGDAHYLGKWISCSPVPLSRTNSQPCLLDEVRTNISNVNTTDACLLEWNGPSCAAEQLSTWTFVPNANLKSKAQPHVCLLGLLIRPATYVHTSGPIKYSIQIEPEKLFGMVRVKNLAFEKSVIIRCSSDNWTNFVDHVAYYLPPLEETAERREYETFAFQIPLPESQSRFEFAILYKWKIENGECGSAWDNNDGQNYALFSDRHAIQSETKVPTHAGERIAE